MCVYIYIYIYIYIYSNGRREHETLMMDDMHCSRWRFVIDFFRLAMPMSVRSLFADHVLQAIAKLPAENSVRT